MVSGDRHLHRTGPRRPDPELDDPRRVDLTFERAAERYGERHRAGQPDPRRVVRDVLGHGHQLLGGGVLVAPGEGVCDGYDDVDLVDPGGLGAGETSLVEDEPHVGDAVHPGYRVHYRLGVGHGRNCVGTDERDRLDPSGSGRHRPLDLGVAALFFLTHVVTGKRPDVSGQVAGRDVGEARLLQHRSHARPQRAPHVGQTGGGPGVGQIAETDVAHAGQRPVDAAQDIGDADFGGGPGQFITAVAAAVAADQSIGSQGGQDVDQELRGNALRLRKIVGLDQRARLERRQLDHGPNGVLRLGRHPHDAHHATDLAANRADMVHHRHMTIRVTCCQIPLTIGDTVGNQTTSTAAIEAAARDGAQIVVLPELASSGYVFVDRGELASLAETRDGPAITAWANLAAAFDVTIVAGFPESAGERIYNSAVVVDPTGVRGIYRKAHLWDTENNVFDRGDDLPLLVDTAHGRIGVMVCYDLEFPEWVRAVALEGADLLCAPVNWPLLPRPDGERPTEMVRALAGAGANRMPIAVCDRAGMERGVDWIGGSVITDADGYPTTIAEFGAPGSITADVDVEQARVKRFNENNDVHGDRRIDLYRRTALLD